MRTVAYIIALFFFMISLANAQSNKKCKWIRAGEANLLLDSLSVLPESITFSTIDTVDFHYDLNSGNITVISFPDNVDSLQVCYKVLPFLLHQKIQHRDLAIYDSSAFFEDKRSRYNTGLFSNREQLFPSEGLAKSGSISRGISFGNTQDVFVNSALNLQLDGKLTDDINIRAVISDQNIPFQPEGNTQQLQEFDKIFVQFYNDHASLTAGDIILRNKPSQFLRYNKNVQGGALSARYDLFKNAPAETMGAVSVAKGKFASEQVEIKEGVLGPYKLKGPQNEAFVIVLANSEKVYLDGQLLQRGYDYDYTIDYNQGEITFTNKVLITVFSRVRVDYEYSDRNYSRTILSGSHYQTIGKFSAFANYYSEKDNPNRPLTFDLSHEEKQYLSEIGNNIRQAVVSGADSVPYNSNIILYKKVDTLNVPSVYVFSTNPDSAVFDVSFSDVGPGNGNYNLASANVNGRIYQWIAPINGLPQGRYEPVIAVPTPSKKQMFTAGGDYELSSHETVFSEVAIADHDVNLFSYDKKGNNGMAYKGGVRSEDRLFPLLKDYRWKAAMNYEFVQSDFQPIDRYREIEFDRNWNFVPTDTANSHDDHIFNVQAGVFDGSNNLLSYKMVRRKRGTAVDGYQQFIDLAQQLGRFKVLSHLFLLHGEQEYTTSDWKKLDASISYSSKIFVPGYQYSMEKNKIEAKGTDSLVYTISGLPVPLNFTAHTFFLKSNDSLPTRFNLNYTIREDLQSFEGVLKEAMQSRTLNFQMEHSAYENHDVDFSFTYRMLENAPHLNRQGREETVMGRINWFADLLKKHLRSELTYAVANAQEPKREFVFLKVPTGEGTHTWRDENKDGIQDLNEFYEAINPDERNYIKIFVPTEDYLLAYSGNFNYRLNVAMPRNWASASGLKAFAAKLSNVTVWNIDKKHTDKKASARFIPFVNAVENEQLLAVQESLRSTFFYDRSNPKFGMDGALLISERKELLTNGFNTRQNKEFQLNSRLNIKRSYNIRVGGMRGEVLNASDFLTGRNYEIIYNTFTPEFEWMPVSNFRLTTKYALTDKVNVLPESAHQESAILHSFGLEGRFTQVAQRTLNVMLKYTNIEFKGDENTPVGYELLNALRPGNNFTWTFNLQQRVAEGLQVSLNYEGRKSSEQAVIHIGRMQVSALF